MFLYLHINLPLKIDVVTHLVTDIPVTKEIKLFNNSKNKPCSSKIYTEY